jgi:hypothetical protein
MGFDHYGFRVSKGNVISIENTVCWVRSLREFSDLRVLDRRPRGAAGLAARPMRLILDHHQEWISPDCFVATPGDLGRSKADPSTADGQVVSSKENMRSATRPQLEAIPIPATKPRSLLAIRCQKPLLRNLLLKRTNS